MQERKIISLLPAATEIICALGLENQLVGRSHECDYPSTVKNLPVCSSAKFLSGSSSSEIDRQVREILSDSLSIYTIDKELLRSIAPDIIITQAQCEVCAVSLKDVELSLSNLLEKDCQVNTFWVCFVYLLHYKIYYMRMHLISSFPNKNE